MREFYSFKIIQGKRARTMLTYCLVSIHTCSFDATLGDPSIKQGILFPAADLQANVEWSGWTRRGGLYSSWERKTDFYINTNTNFTVISYNILHQKKPKVQTTLVILARTIRYRLEGRLQPKCIFIGEIKLLSSKLVDMPWGCLQQTWLHISPTE